MSGQMSHFCLDTAQFHLPGHSHPYSYQFKDFKEPEYHHETFTRSLPYSRKPIRVGNKEVPR